MRLTSLEEFGSAEDITLTLIDHLHLFTTHSMFWESCHIAEVVDMEYKALLWDKFMSTATVLIIFLEFSVHACFGSISC